MKVVWDNSSTGDNNADTISTVTFNLTGFGGGAAVAATDGGGACDAVAGDKKWTACQVIPVGAINSTTVTATTTVTDNAGNATTSGNSANQKVNNLAPTFTIDNVTQAEGNGPGTTNFVFTVTKVGATAFDATVNYTTSNGSATGGSCGGVGVDYTTTSGSLSFLAADTTKPITIPVCGDTDFEPDETFKVILTSNTINGNTVITNTQGTGTITNDDPAPTLGNYSNTFVSLSGNTTVTPSAAPSNTTSATAKTSATFKGTLFVNPTTGVVTVTDAHPAGTYTVTVTPFNGGAGTPKTFDLTVTTPTTCNPVSFATASSYSTGFSPVAVAIGDFNNDGIQDLVATNVSQVIPPNKVSILLGNGSGGFGAATGFDDGGGGPQAVVVGDFNSDGKQDLAVANQSSSNVSILLGNGGGGFGGPTTFGVGSTPFSIVMGDFNGDGKLDLATANFLGSSVSILIGDGAGGFTVSGIGVGSFNISLAVGDVNNDNKQDLVVADNSNKNVVVLTGDGAGGFSNSGTYTLGGRPQKIALADFNNDGFLDLASANNFGANGVSVLLNNGSGGFNAFTNYPTGSNTLGVAAGDFNGDGNQDIAASNLSSGNVSILLGNGAGAFASATQYSVGGGPYSVVVGDFNGDNLQDLAFAGQGSDRVIVLLRECPVNAVVTKTADTDGVCVPGDCSLREAIKLANTNPDTSTITFAIPLSDPGCNAGAGPCTIMPGSALPAITQPVTINGYSQPGASMNTLTDSDNAVILIELDGTNAGANVNGLTVNALSFIQGLAINRFTGNGIGLLAGSGSSGVAGNFIGTDVSGTLAAANGDAGLFMTNTSNVLVGCTVASERNVISGNTAEGVEIFNATNNFVQGNFIGVAADGTSLLGNGGAGVEIYMNVANATNNTIGVIPSIPNNQASRVGSGSGFGCRASQSASPTRDRDGRSAASSSVQSTLLSGANVIAGNGGDGVRVTNSGDINNRISQNSIYSNTGLGINLGTDSVTANDAGDGDDGPNHLQNFPVITVAAASGGTGTIGGTLDSGGPLPADGAAPFTIEFYKNSSCNAVAPNDYGEGQIYLGSLTVMSGGAFTSGTLNISAGDIVTATATDASGNTSEFGQCFTVTSANTAPAWVTSSITVNEPTGAEASPIQRSANLTVNELDDGQSLTFSVVGTGQCGASPLAPFTFVDFNPNPVTSGPGNETTALRLNVHASDAGSWCLRIKVNDGFTDVTQDLNVTVQAQNSTPVLAAINTNDQITVSEPSGTQSNTQTDFNLSASDLDSNQSLTFDLLTPSSCPGGQAGFAGASVFTDTRTFSSSPSTTSSATGRLRITAGPNDAGTYCLRVRVSDGAGGTATRDVALTITAANSSPIATNDNYATDENTPLSVPAPGVLTNDTDADSGQTRTAIQVSGPSHASSFTLNANGSFSYTPVAGFAGTDTFTYKARDNSGDAGTQDSNTATVTITVNPTSCTPAPSGMIAWWPGDGNTDDIVGGHNGSLQNGATFAAGKVNQAFAFDGSNAVVQVADNAAWNFGANDFTIDTWVNFNAISGNDVLVAHDEGTGHGNNKWIFWLNQGQLKVHLNGPAFPLGAGVDIGVPWAPAAGLWYHVAVTRSGSSNAYKFYVDGAQIGTDQIDATVIPVAVAPLTIGKAEAIPSLNGLLDEVEIFNRALTSNEVQAIYGHGSFGKCRTCTAAPSGMVGWWPGNGNTNDIFGTANGTVVGSVGFSAGKVSQAFDLPGTPGNYVDFGNSPALNVAQNGDFTVDAWAYPRFLSQPTGNPNYDIVTKLGMVSGAPNADGWRVLFMGGRPTFCVGDGFNGCGPGAPFTVMGPLVSANTWTHVAALKQGNVISIYVNGVLGESKTISGYFDSGTPHLVVGTSPTEGTFFGGLVDEVELFNRALSASEIAAIVDAGNAGKCHTSTLQFSSPTYTVSENGTNATITVTRTGAHDTAATIAYATVAGGTATGNSSCTAGTDYRTTSGTLNFAINEVSKTFNVPICDDSVFENDETVNLQVSNVTGTGASLGAQDTSVLTIHDNDNAPSFTIDDVTHNEGNASTTSYTFTVTKTGSTALSSSVNFTTQDGSATLADSDYQTNSGMLTFGSAVTTMQLTVLVNGDTNFEPNEAFTVHLSVASGATIADADGTGTITNDDSPSISGHLNYADGSTPGKNVTMTLTGNNGFVTRMTTTDLNGDYTFTSVPVGNNYTITPSKTGDVNGLQSFDASNVARYVAGLDVPTANQRIAADADNDGVLTSFDAALIARYVAGLPGTGIIGAWKFVPASRTYSALGANQSAQDFTAILVGDTSGDWAPSAASHDSAASSPTFTVNGIAQTPGASSPATVAVTVSLPNVPGAPGSTISVPIMVSDLSGLGVKAYDLQVTFNAAIVQPDATPTDTAGTISSGMLITPNATNPGHLIISAFQATDLTGSGTLIKLRFTVVGTAGQSTPLTFQDYTDPGTIFHPGFRFNAGTPTATTTNGSVTVNGPTASVGTVDGHITDENGRPISGAVVRLSGAQNRETITDSNGNYSFFDVSTNGFYTVTPSRVNYNFSPPNRSFSALGAHTEASFTASANGDHANAIDTTEFFVRQQYLDFLGREPDPPGFIGWVNTIANCAPNDASCDRVHVSEMFFRSQEFQERGYFVYRFYSSAFGRKPGLAEFTPDLARVSGFLTNDQLEAAKTAFTNDFMARPGFAAQYGSLNNAAFVDALINTAAVNLSTRQALIDGLNAGALTRGQVLRQIAESGEVHQKYYNQAFVVMEYFGYLRRDPDALYLNWIQVLDANPADSRHMVEGFVNSTEYRNRFAQ
jgi:CSLREA domain-containing protein